MSQFSIVQDILDERTRQNIKWGEQNHDPYRWIGILTEEVGEVAQAVNGAIEGPAETVAERWGRWQAYREELIQVAAVAIAMVECWDRNNKLRRES